MRSRRAGATPAQVAVSRRRAALYGLLAVLIAGGAPAPARAQYEAYLWEFPRVTAISPEADGLKEILRAEVQAILTAGRLRPLRTFNGDQFAASGYFLYWERGRILTTLAWAWPHLTGDQRAAVSDYVRAEVADPAYTPWLSSPRHIPPQAGARREYHPAASVWNWDSFWNLDGDTRPIVQALYGLWLYAYRTYDWSLVAENWSAIKGFYSAHQGEGGLYGTMCAHVAMARMAAHQGDDAMLATATAAANAQLTAGLDFGAVDARAASAYAGMYEARRASELYLGFPFLNLSPEVGRYLRDLVAGPVLARHAEGTERYPAWFVLHAPHFTYWTGGDEGNGIPVEIVGMAAPIERWVREAGAAQLATWARSAPAGRGDCYWLEALVQAIEAHGTLVWVDVRDGSAVADPGQAVQPTLRLLAIEPNPVAQCGQVRFRLEGPPRTVGLRLFDAAGRLVARGGAAEPMRGAAALALPGTDAVGRPLASGIYLCRIDAGGLSDQARVVVLR